MNRDLKRLSEPFPARDIEWRVGRSGINNSGPHAMVLAYVTARAIQDRLDEVCGPAGWKNEFKPGPMGGILCGISIYTDEVGWVTKWNGADNTDIEAIKGGLSASTKRAGVEWGIGRYLYKVEQGWAEFRDDGIYSCKIKYQGKDNWYKWNPPQLPVWALPKDADAGEKPIITADYIEEETYTYKVEKELIRSAEDMEGLKRLWTTVWRKLEGDVDGREVCNKVYLEMKQKFLEANNDTA